MCNSFYYLTPFPMKSFMQVLLATFGVMALVFAGCNTTDVEEEDMDTEDVDMEEEVEADADMEDEDMSMEDEEEDMEEGEEQ